MHNIASPVARNRSTDLFLYLNSLRLTAFFCSTIFSYFLYCNVIRTRRSNDLGVCRVRGGISRSSRTKFESSHPIELITGPWTRRIRHKIQFLPKGLEIWVARNRIFTNYILHQANQIRSRTNKTIRSGCRNWDFVHFFYIPYCSVQVWQAIDYFVKYIVSIESYLFHRWTRHVGLPATKPGNVYSDRIT